MARGDRERLAFLVQPADEESFGSWVRRLCARHELTWPAMLRHLGCDPALAGLDLTLGIQAVPIRLRESFERMVTELAWAVDVTDDDIAATFVDVNPAYMLPLSSRRYGCLECWIEGPRPSGPMIVKRDWELRASWWCARHNLALCDSASLRRPHTGDEYISVLQGVADRTRRRQRRMLLLKTMTKENERLIYHLMAEHRGGRFNVPEPDYFVRFADNQYHLSANRIGLLMHAHGRIDRPARCFERFVALTRGQLREKGQGALDWRHLPPRQLAPRPQRTPSRRIVWKCDTWDLLQAFGQVWQRREARHSASLSDGSVRPERASAASAAAMAASNASSASWLNGDGLA